MGTGEEGLDADIERAKKNLSDLKEQKRVQDEIIEIELMRQQEREARMNELLMSAAT